MQCSFTGQENQQHYQRIVDVLAKMMTLMDCVDEAIEERGGGL